jgi:hypothetical protein
MSKSKYFFCYNSNVSQHLKSKGIPLITIAQDLKTSKVFTLYEITPEFQDALNSYVSPKQK